MLINTLETKNKGFSLTEMIIVIMIIGILTIFAAQWLPGTIDQVKIDKTRVLMGEVAKACRLYAFDHGGNYPGKVEYLWPKYINTIPKSPFDRHEPIEISFGKKTEIVCYIRWKDTDRRLAIPLDTLGFVNDNKANLPAGTAFSIAKTYAAPQTGEINIYFVTLDIDYKTQSTTKYPDLGSDFRFFVDDAEIISATSNQGAPITLSSLGGLQNTGFEYSFSPAGGNDRITVNLKNCKRSTNFTIQIYRPGPEDPAPGPPVPGIPIFYGEKKVLEATPGSAVPITLTRLVAESTSVK